MAQIASPTPAPAPRGPSAVLVIDGNEEHQILSVTALGRGGYRVAVADTGREGLRLARAQPFDVVVVASKLRDAPGLEVLRSLHSSLPGVPLIFVVPEGAEDLVVRALSSGASGYLVKTPRYHELLPSVVEEQIAKVRFRARLQDQQRALEDAETRFQEFLRAAREPVFVIDPTGAFLAANDAMSAVTGYTPEALMQKNLFDLVVLEAGIERSTKLADLVRPDFQGSLEFTLRRNDGVEIVLEFVPKLVRKDDEIVGIEAIARDITQRKKVEHQLRDIYGWLHAIYEATNDAVLIADTDSRLVQWNARALELLRTDGRQISNATMADLLRGLAARSKSPQAILSALESYGKNPEAVVEGNIEVSDPDTRVYWRMTAPVHSLEGVRIGRLWTFRDVTERIEMNRRLLETERQAALGRLSAHVAHEINTPLTNIALLTAGISRRVKDPEVRAKLDRIDAQRRLAANIISDLLHFHRKRNVDAVATDLRQVVASAIEDLAPYRKETVALLADTDGPPVDVWADPSQLGEVFVNLLRNAFDATPAGTITVRIVEGPEDVAVVVQDTGSGMAPEVKDRLFEPFFTTKRIGEGTGLGLSMCRSIVEAHAGRIEVDSESGKGSTFTVRLPRRVRA